MVVYSLYMIPETMVPGARRQRVVEGGFRSELQEEGPCELGGAERVRVLLPQAQPLWVMDSRRDWPVVLVQAF
jgi:hypothetical protein